jgi:hypothetical protein
MNIKGLLRPTNRSKRLLVGLFLGVLFCIQCTQDMQANKPGTGISAVVREGKVLAAGSSDLAATVDKLAKTDHVGLLKFCQDNYQKRYSDYTCTFVKQETIRGRLGKEQMTAVKFMERPFSVVMTWTANRPSPADRVLFVDGKYDGKVLCRPVGVLGAFGTQVRDPWGDDAKVHSLKPITEFGIAKMTQSLIDVYEVARKLGDSTEEFGGYFEMNGRRCVMLIRHLKANPVQNYPAKKTYTYIDTEYLVPVCVKGWDWSDQFSCTYGFKDIKFNMGLTENDFLPQSNEMKPPR